MEASVISDITNQMLDIVLAHPGISVDHMYNMLRKPVKITEYELTMVFIFGNKHVPVWLRLMKDSQSLRCYAIDHIKYQKDTRLLSKGAEKIDKMYKEGKLNGLMPPMEDARGEAERRGNFEVAQQLSYESLQGQQRRRLSVADQAALYDGTGRKYFT
jgi:hypothetical protein